MVITILSEFKFLVTCSTCTKHIEVAVIFPPSAKNSKSYVTLSSIYSLLLQRYQFILCNNCCNFLGRLAGKYRIGHVHFQYLWSDSVFEKYLWGINLNQKDMVYVTCNTVHCFIKTAYREILKKLCGPENFIDSELPPIYNLPFVRGQSRVIFDWEMRRISKIAGTLFNMYNKMKQKGKVRMLDFQYSVEDRDAASTSAATDQSYQEPAENGVSSLGDQRRDGNLVTTVMVYYNDFDFTVTCHGCLRQIEITVIMPPSAQYSETYVSLRSVYSVMQDQFEFLFCESCHNFIKQLSIECEVDNNSIFQEVWADTLINAYIIGINFSEDIFIDIHYSYNHCFLGIKNRDMFDRMCNFKNCIEFKPCTENIHLVELESTSTSTSDIEAEQMNDISNALDAWEQQNILSFKRFFSGSTTDTTKPLLRPIEKSDSDSLSSLSDDEGAKLILLQPSRSGDGVDNREIPTGSTNSDGGNEGTNGSERVGKIRLRYFTAARTFTSNSEDGSHSSLSSDDDEDVGAKLILLPSCRNIGVQNRDGVSNNQAQTTNHNTNLPTLDYFQRPTNVTNRPKWGMKKGKELFSSCASEVDTVMVEDPEQLDNVWIPSSSSEILYNGVDDDSDSASVNTDDDMAAEVILIQPFGVTRHIRLQNEGTSSTGQNETANPNNQPIVDYSDGSVRIMMFDSEDDLSDESDDLNMND